MGQGDCSAEQIARITQMEGALKRLNQALEIVEKTVKIYGGMWHDYQALAAYYSSASWWEDLAADEQGQLPSNLPRGVLSEDGIYNALGYADSLRDQLIDVTNDPKNARQH